MDFTLELSAEWLKNRRGLVAQASKKTRQKKKQEREDLLEQNQHLREERKQILDKLSELESEINKPLRSEDALLTLENERLRQELEQHKQFVSGVFQQLGNVEQSQKSSMGELSKQNREFSMLHFLRLLADSQSNLEWKRPPFPEHEPFFKPMEVTVLYHRSHEGVLNLRVDFSLYEHVCPVKLRDAMTKCWEDLDAYEAVFGKGSLSLSRELVEFRVEDNHEVLECFHTREPSADADYRYRDLVYLVAKGSVDLAKSTLNLGVRGDLATCVSGEIKKRPKLDMVGTANCAFYTKTITEHGDSDSDSFQAKRMMSTNLEAIFCWNENEVEDERTSAVWMFTFAPSFESYVGGPNDYISEKGTVGAKAVQVFQDLLKTCIAKALTAE
ncbi:hypothetical protein BASA81_000663 [Batrachochytrium salamandrivorans]|nr:hypothetical protein BASA81_000663 [Batrachochytrium salamandrivorans]